MMGRLLTLILYERFLRDAVVNARTHVHAQGATVSS